MVSYLIETSKIQIKISLSEEIMKSMPIWAVIAAFSFASFNVIAQDASSLEEPFSEDSSDSGDSGSDPIQSAKSNLEFTMKSYGNVSTNATLDNIDSSVVQVGAAGNTVTLSGNIDNMQVTAENYGSANTNATMSNVTGSNVGINAAGNAITVK
jgi:hypothetical protein